VFISLGVAGKISSCTFWSKLSSVGTTLVSGVFFDNSSQELSSGSFIS